MNDKDNTAKPAPAPTPAPGPAPTPPRPKTGLVELASFANPDLLISAVTFPLASGEAVTLDLKRPAPGLQPFSWWLLNPVTPDNKIFQILFFPSDGNLCLTAGASGAAATLTTVDPANQAQLWQLDITASGAQLIKCYTNDKQSLGYVNDIPLKGLPLITVTSPDKHERGDTLLKSDDAFLIRPVSI